MEASAFIQQEDGVETADICKDHLGHSAEQTVGTELLIKTEVTAPDGAHLLQLIDQPDDFFESEENPIATKLEYEEVDKQLQTTNDVMGLEQDDLNTHRKKHKHHRPHYSTTYPTQETPYSGKVSAKCGK
ncbi:uncharacterized protein LOC128276489 [Anopheles cruzii]|uniref:uncharacterized protein LOC128276487 n=1 Tax=Anopheles cruzii TaxID=68878 RepID=UPI0022EC441A|nr:uncharacterized protein LOC128276487 [Anopheles cruzii]XP_052870908.1 uncharacterized protein LOC128276489 [Anopheles cruzii]